MVICTVPLQPPPIPKNLNNHNSLCLSLADDLLRRGRLSLAQQVIQRIIAHSPTVSDAISAVDFAAGRGMELGVGIYGAFVRRLIELGQSKLAYAVYCDNVIAKGIDLDSGIINSMVICLVKLGKLEDAGIFFYNLIGSGSVPCQAACNALFREFCMQEMFLEAFDCLVSISKAKIRLRMRCYNVLIDGLCYKGQVGEAMKVFDIMRERTGFLPTLHNYKSLFYGLCKRGWVVEAESVCGEMEEHGFFLDKVMYTSLMNVYLKDKKINKAMMVFLRMLKMGCDPDTFTYTALIQGIFKMGHFDKGWMLYNQMNESRMLPDAVTYHILISNYCKAGKVICATMLLNNMACCNLVPSVHSYTALMAALYKDNRFTEVDEVYKSMLNCGVIPDHVLFLILMKNSLTGNELQLSLLMLQDILKHGCGLDPSLLSGSTNVNPMINLEQEIELLLEKIIRSNLNLANVAFGIYITALCERGKIDGALLCLRKMIDVGCSPLPFTFNSLFKCIRQDGHLESFEPLIDIMQEWGIVPDLATYLIMVNEYCKWKDLTSAFHVLDQMEERGLKPSVAIYDSIISCLSKEKRMFEAETLFRRMHEAGVDLDATVYTTMINGYFKNGQALEAHQLFEKMIKNDVQPSSHTYTALISGLVKSNMTGKGCRYLDRMLGDGFVPNAVLHTSLIYHFLRKGEFEFAFRLVDLMDSSQIELDVIFYIALVSGLCRNIVGIKKRCKINRTSETKKAREMLLQLLHQRKFVPRETILRFPADSSEHIKCFALELMHRIKRTKFMPNLYLYNSIIFGFCWADRIEDAYNDFELMQKEGICPNEVTFTILIGAYSRAGQINRAIELFNVMNADGYRPDKVTYNTLLRGLCKAGRELNALSLVSAMHKRGSS
ncbi:hypothetical protein GH714_022629 [Hevea brasiliensis]|uniref:Pentacotripeptide-repeat region of PRORP domain-containing protein n=1 Tax=Hevea brasiliensis TaxID=3981 RepID=A0A6A6KLD5_HEVBR|nr:hypothetical protein GH714_022629 [Hevea brasiliensis]